MHNKFAAFRDKNQSKFLFIFRLLSTAPSPSFFRPSLHSPTPYLHSFLSLFFHLLLPRRVVLYISLPIESPQPFYPFGRGRDMGCHLATLQVVGTTAYVAILQEVTGGPGVMAPCPHGTSWHLACHGTQRLPTV